MTTRSLPLLLLGAVAGGCVEPEPWFCSDDLDCPDTMTCRPYFCSERRACATEGEHDPGSLPSLCQVDGRCDLDRCESCVSCPEDCCAGCDATRLAALPPFDFLVSSYRLVNAYDDPEAFGLDLDGDEAQDNKLGTAINVSWSEEEDPDPQLALDARLRNGESLVVLRLQAPGLVGDATEVLVQPLLAEVLDATPAFDGQDRVALAPDASRDASACGALAGSRLVSQPSRPDLRFPIPYDVNAGRRVPLWIRHARIVASVSPTGLTEIWIGGGIPRTEIEAVVWPLLAEVLTRQASSGAGSHADSMNGACWDDHSELCQEAAAGPECAREEPPVITVTEIRCDSIFRTLFAPDLDLDHDGIKESLSFAFRLEAVPVTLVE